MFFTLGTIEETEKDKATARRNRQNLMDVVTGKNDGITCARVVETGAIFRKAKRAALKFFAVQY